jgi:transposase
MLRPSFVPPRPIRQLRDLTRYRIDLVGARTAEKNRVEKLLEDACIKLSVVASDIFGVSGRQTMAALIAGERDPKVLAEMARTRMRAKIPQLVEAFAGHFDDHHRFLLARCWPASTGSTPTSRCSTPRSRPTCFFRSCGGAAR